MASANRPFEFGRKDYIDKLNDLYNAGIPRVRTDPTNPDAATTDVTASRQMKLGDNGCVVDVRGTSISITFAAECLIDGYSVIINSVSGGSVTVSTASLGVNFLDAAVSTKSITVGNAAIISSDGIGFRIFRMVAA